VAIPAVALRDMAASRNPAASVPVDDWIPACAGMTMKNNALLVFLHNLCGEKLLLSRKV